MIIQEGPIISANTTAARLYASDPKDFIRNSIFYRLPPYFEWVVLQNSKDALDGIVLPIQNNIS
jgi:hypothetical protein